MSMGPTSPPIGSIKLRRKAGSSWDRRSPALIGLNSKSAYHIEAFDINIAKRMARCPGGYGSTQCSRLEQQKRNKVNNRFEWSYHCRNCPLRSECVPAKQSHRTIVVGQHHELLQQRRRDRQTQTFKERMHQRSAIEGTISELTRAHGLRTSRYRGFAKVELQNLFIATACNVKRWLRRLAQAQIGSKSRSLPFRKPMLWISRLAPPRLTR